jgi:predicted house-cleaning noncanonical NTP pyrophosphatase (MazG superfamily)
MKIYNKLIRDKIPEIIKNDGNMCETNVLNNKDYLKELNKKLYEELKEYDESGEIEELADLTELIYAIAKFKGCSIEEFNNMRINKREKRGGFKKRLFLTRVYDFNEIWNEIIKTVHTGDVIYTLAQHNANAIIDINEDGISVKTNDEPELVKKEWIKAAWSLLAENGQLTANDIPGPGAFRSSFILALFAKLSYVEYMINPIRLYLNRGDIPMENNNDKFILPDNLKGRSLHAKVIPTVCNLENMLENLIKVGGDYYKLKQWEKRSYKAYIIGEIVDTLLFTEKNNWKDIIREHILSKRPSDFGASCIDIYFVAYVSETYGTGKDILLKYIKDNHISDKNNSAQAIWQVGKGDGVFLDILNLDGTVKDWDFIRKWAL